MLSLFPALLGEPDLTLLMMDAETLLTSRLPEVRVVARAAVLLLLIMGVLWSFIALLGLACEDEDKAALRRWAALRARERARALLRATRSSRALSGLSSAEAMRLLSEVRSRCEEV